MDQRLKEEAFHAIPDLNGGLGGNADKAGRLRNRCEQLGVLLGMHLDRPVSL